MTYVDSAHKPNGLDSAIHAMQGFYALSQLLATGKEMRKITVKVKQDYTDYWKHRSWNDEYIEIREMEMLEARNGIN